MVTNQVAMLAMHKGQELMTSSVAKYLPGAMALWRSLRYYFRVNNTYVRTKLTRVLFPFTYKKWQRAPPSSADEEGPYAPPASDSNAPDLYIPLMAFVTYVLATGGAQRRDEPQRGAVDAGGAAAARGHVPRGRAQRAPGACPPRPAAAAVAADGARGSSGTRCGHRHPWAAWWRKVARTAAHQTAHVIGLRPLFLVRAPCSSI
jgi:hypothetical protein